MANNEEINEISDLKNVFDNDKERVVVLHVKREKEEEFLVIRK